MQVLCLKLRPRDEARSTRPQRSVENLLFGLSLDGLTVDSGGTKGTPCERVVENLAYVANDADATTPTGSQSNFGKKRRVVVAG
jgi:hypothetical protein